MDDYLSTHYRGFREGEVGSRQTISLNVGGRVVRGK